MNLSYCTFRTDEQAPIPGVFDDLVERLCVIEEHSDVVFNCQMGYVYSLNKQAWSNNYWYDQHVSFGNDPRKPGDLG